MIIKKTALVERDGTWTFRNTLYAGAALESTSERLYRASDSPVDAI